MDQAFRRAFGRALRALREDRGLTQQELDFQSDIHRTTISLWERGERLPSLDNLRTLAQALDTSASELLRLADAQLEADKRRRKPPPKRSRGRPPKR
ncbi:MAG: helix-turn-helix transcriptional regulator [Acidimicrobiia bacterium]